MVVTTSRISWSAKKKKIDDNPTITNTMIVVIMVSRRDGQVTFWVSERTSCRNLNGLSISVSCFATRLPNLRVGRQVPRLKDQRLTASVQGISCPVLALQGR